ncbi:MAG: putative sulfate exporter family transporter, partial [Thermoproteus sp.]|nr:putative sulfate exporter family transporter [Thermoproteus sp.]
ASIAAAGAIGAPAIYATMVSAAVLIYAVVGLLVVPYVAVALVKAGFMSPAAAGALAGLSVKTDGAVATTAQIISSYLGTDTPLTLGVMTKVLIDVWIGVIAFVLAFIWVFYVLPRRGRQAGAKPSAWELWFRFPKFVLGYFATSIVASLLVVYLASTAFAAAKAPVDAATKYLSSYLIGQGTDPFRILFFGLTFVAIGVNTRFSLLRQYGIWRLFAAYGLALLIIILIALGLAKSLFG